MICRTKYQEPSIKTLKRLYSWLVALLRNLLISYRFCAGMDIGFYQSLWSGLNYMISTFYHGLKPVATKMSLLWNFKNSFHLHLAQLQ